MLGNIHGLSLHLVLRRPRSRVIALGCKCDWARTGGPIPSISPIDLKWISAGAASHSAAARYGCRSIPLLYQTLPVVAEVALGLFEDVQHGIAGVFPAALRGTFA
jgi:hypothetical protein